MQAIDVKKIMFIALYVFTALLAYSGIKSLIDSLKPADGLMGLYGQYVGRDFVFFYAAARHAVTGNIADLYNNYWVSNTSGSIIPELGNQILSYWGWLYPPHYLLLLAPLGFLPYYFALALWLAISVVFPAFVLWHFWKMRGALWLATILNINVIYCLSMGQNTLIFAAITGMGIASLQKRPMLAGICFAVLSMKPHFALLIPLALILGRYWQVLIYTIAITLLLMAVTGLAFGWDVWAMAIAHFNSVQNVSLASDIWFFSIYSAYRALLELSLPNIYAWVGYFIVAAFALYGFGKIWLGKHDSATKWLAFAVAVVLFSPYSLAYDAAWLVLPVMAWFSNRSGQNDTLPFFAYPLFAILIFAIAIISISQKLTILIILSALIVLLCIANDRKILSGQS